MLIRRIVTGIVLLTGIAAVAQPPSKGSRPERKMDPEIVAYKLSMPKLQTWMGITVKLKQMMKDHPELENMSAADGAKTLEQAAQQIEAKLPQVATLIKSNGMTVREYLTIPAALMAAGGALMVKQQGGDPAKLSTPENMAFYTQHKAEIDKMMASMNADDKDDKDDK